MRSRSVYDPRRWLPVDPPIRGAPGARSAEVLRAVAAQFDVLRNPRYTRDGRRTWCNIFLADVLAALGCGEWLHWVEVARIMPDGSICLDHAGTPTPLPDPAAAHDPAAPRIRLVEQNANDMGAWFLTSGPRFGWTEVDSGSAGAFAAHGMPVAVSHVAPGGIGHVALLLPPVGVQHRIAQAGAHNLFDAPLEAGFGRLPVKFFSHA